MGGSIAGAVEESGGEEVVPKPKKKKRRKKKVQRPKGGANVLTGVIGGMVGAAIGAGIWFCLARYAGLNLGIIAWLVGGLVGFGSKIGAGEDSDLVAIFAGGMALGAILGGQFMAINGLIMADRGMADLDLVYEMHQEMAKEVVAAEDDRELTRVLMDWYDEDYNPAEIKEYKQKDLPFMRKMATGNATKKEFQQFMTARLDPWDEFKTSFGIKMYIWIFFGIGTAYRIPGGGTED